jgi:hypothetical protein
MRSNNFTPVFAGLMWAFWGFLRNGTLSTSGTTFAHCFFEQFAELLHLASAAICEEASTVLVPAVEMAKANPMRVAAVRADVVSARFGAVVVTAVVIFHHVVRSLLAFSPFIWLRWRSIGFTGGVAMIGAYFGLDVFDFLILKVALVAVVPIVVIAIVILWLVVVAVQIAVWFAVKGIVFALRLAAVILKVPFGFIWVCHEFVALRAVDSASAPGLPNLFPLGFPAFLGLFGVFHIVRLEAVADVVLVGVQQTTAHLARRNLVSRLPAFVGGLCVADAVGCWLSISLGLAFGFGFRFGSENSLGLFPDGTGGYGVTFTSDPYAFMLPMVHDRRLLLVLFLSLSSLASTAADR